MQENQSYTTLEITYTGLHKFFSNMFKKGVTELKVGVENLTVREAELIQMVGSEYLYILLDMETKDAVTEVIFMNELD